MRVVDRMIQLLVSSGVFEDWKGFQLGMMSLEMGFRGDDVGLLVSPNVLGIQRSGVLRLTFWA